MSNISTKQSEEPESISAQNFVLEKSEREEDTEGTEGYQETEVLEERGQGELGALSLESENGPSEEFKEGTENKTKTERE